MKEQPLVEILLATYRGAQKLDEQINSLFAQTYKNWQLLIRDDGSDDATKDIIEKLVSKHPERVHFIQDSSGRLGPAGSFSTLLSHSFAEYVMFCDQDDVWLSDKIQVTLDRMQKFEDNSGKKIPVLIHSDLKVVDKCSAVVAASFWKHQNIHPRKRETINRLLVQNVVTGCTVMINNVLRDFSLPVPDDAVMHDWWLALVATAFGKVEHVDQPTILYRQHDANVVGVKGWGIPFVLNNLLGHDGQVRERILNTQKQARAFLERYRDTLPEDKRKVVECYAHLDGRPYLERVSLLIKHRLFKAGLIRNLGFWAHI
jgi:glycosyltransferase involved in cell wall biosynthesis